MTDVIDIIKKAEWIRRETLLLHAMFPESRIASALSCVEILAALFYGDVMRFRADCPDWPERDRLVISKGHGAVPMYAILADLGFIKGDVMKTEAPEPEFSAIPDPRLNGIETLNGSLGHGLGVGCGMALGIREHAGNSRVIVLSGDGELNEGAMWEAVMFAGHHRLNNMLLIVDNNRAAMLDWCRNTIDMEPLEKKFEAFGWRALRVDGHDVDALASVLGEALNDVEKPCVIVARTVKGKGVPRLENDPMSHLRILSVKEIEDLIK